MKPTTIDVALGILTVMLLSAGSTNAQTSANYKLEQHALNSGGRPSGGSIVTSANYRVTLDSIGDGISARGLTGASYSMDLGLVNVHRPPAEVQGLRFDDKLTLRWDADPSAGSYNLYRAPLGTLGPGGSYGACQQQNIALTTTTDSDPPPAPGGFFYLVTVENRITEEGTRGYTSSSVERGGPVCP
jgi:hypothetical protein